MAIVGLNEPFSTIPLLAIYKWIGTLGQISCLSALFSMVDLPLYFLTLPGSP
jgi:hypothetical protein